MIRLSFLEGGESSLGHVGFFRKREKTTRGHADHPGAGRGRRGTGVH